MAALVQSSVSHMNDAIWNSLNPRNEWEPLDIIASNTVEMAFSSGNRTRFEILGRDGKSYEVDIKESVMKFNARGRNRVVKLHRQSQRNGVPAVIWEWSDNGLWIEYGSDEIDLLNVAKAAGDSDVNVFIGTGDSIYSFKINFTNMKQISLSGRGTGWMRPIRSRRTDLNAATPAPPNASVLTDSVRAQMIETVLAKAHVGTADASDECSICMEPFECAASECPGAMSSAQLDEPMKLQPEASAVVSSSAQSSTIPSEKTSYRLAECGPHFYHRSCIAKQLKVNGKCAYCGKHYLELEGTQPKNGVMTHRIHPPGQISLQGFPRTIGTIVIQYSFNNGIQGAEHPHPGLPYSGTHRSAYLPDNAAGRELLELLQRAFRQRLVFTVGQSVTSGMDNCVVWNGIHHKTSPSGGSGCYGWPDETYFERVKEELKAKGITP